jgi:hypothetical protein
MGIHDHDMMEDIVESTEDQSLADNSQVIQHESGPRDDSKSQSLSQDDAILSGHGCIPNQADPPVRDQRGMSAPLSNNGGNMGHQMDSQPYQSLFGGPSVSVGPSLFGGPSVSVGPSLFGGPSVSGGPSIFGGPSLSSGTPIFSDPAEDVVGGHPEHHTSTEGAGEPADSMELRPTLPFDVLPVDPLTPGFGIRRGISNFHLAEPEPNDSSSEHSFRGRSYLLSSNLGSSSPRASGASSDDEYFYIPPDDKVSVQ